MTTLRVERCCTSLLHNHDCIHSLHLTYRNSFICYLSRMKRCKLLLMILTCVNVASANIENVVAKCCSQKYQDCCREAIIGQTPLKCGTSVEAHTNATCIQTEMYGESSSNMIDFGDDKCCDIQLQMQNSKEEWRNLCHYTISLPSISGSMKLRKIKDSAPNIEIFTCFRKCQFHLRTSTSEFSIKHCNVFKMMKTGHLYIGPKADNYETHSE